VTELADALATTIEAGDMVVCLGAGDITKWAAGLAGALTAHSNSGVGEAA
jgi:UDP-N-acetylmuramate--alanine ligase